MEHPRFLNPKKYCFMETAIIHQEKIDRLEVEKKRLEDRIRQLKRAAHTTERKRLTRAKIILGSLVLRDHQQLLAMLIATASSQDAEFLRSVFPLSASDVHSLPATRPAAH